MQIKLEIEIDTINKNNISKKTYHNFNRRNSYLGIESFEEEGENYDFMKIKEEFKPYFHFYFNDDEAEKKLASATCNDPNVKKIKVIIDYEVDNLDSLFYNCSITKKINFIEFPRNNIKSMKYMFSGENIKEINFCKFNCTNVINMESMFNGCKNLVELNLSNFTTTNVTNMSKMFNECSFFKEIKFI